MMYDQVPQTKQVDLFYTLNHPKLRNTPKKLSDFPCDEAPHVFFPTPFGTSVRCYSQGHGGIVSDEGAIAAPLLFCAGVIYIYTNGANVLDVVVYHASTGNIPQGHTALSNDFNKHACSPTDIHVLFASSTSLDSLLPEEKRLSHTANGVFTLLDEGIPRANIRVLADAVFAYGSNTTPLSAF